MHNRSALLSLTLLLSAAACASSSNSMDVVTGLTPQVEVLTDANIAAIVVTANNADISYAQLAMALAQDTAVKSFAQTMMTDHNGVNKLAVDLVTKLNVQPVDNMMSLDMKENAEEKRDELRELSGAAFDRAYIDNEISYHEKLLRTIDERLVPSAKNAELKSLLLSVRPAVASHLARARILRPKLR